MYSFLICLVVLVVGYFIYGRIVEKIVAPDSSKVTVAVEKNDGVDFIPMKSWRLFLIQFLNIAGLGPIFGAIMGAKFGVASYVWIVLGSIFAGAMHDYVAGMISLRNGGESLPESIGRYLGGSARGVMRVITLILLILVGVIFVSGPADILSEMTIGAAEWADKAFWIIVIFSYYFLVTLVPVDKVIGKVYPIFAGALLFMVCAIFVMLFKYGWGLPEFTDTIPAHPDGIPIFPIMFVSIACGAISGFHATQSPMMARCMKNEKTGRPIFYGAMIVEGIVALVWAAAAICFFGENGMGESSAAKIVDIITKHWLGTFGAILAMLGAVFAPITSGDTALRSARLIVGEVFNIDQSKAVKRLLTSAAIFAIALGVLIYSLEYSSSFNIMWRYFGVTNQALALMTLWMITVYLVREKKNYIISLIPALFMTSVVFSYIFVAPECLNLDAMVGYIVGGVVSIISLILFILWLKKEKR